MQDCSLTRDALACVFYHMEPVDIIRSQAASKSWKEDTLAVLKTIKCLNLRKFHLNNSQLAKLVEYCPNTTSLRLSPTGLDNESLRIITGFKALEVFSVLGAKGITDVTPLSGLISLKSISLACSGVKDVAPLTKLPHLTRLNIWSCGIRVAELPAFPSTCTVTIKAKQTGAINVPLADRFAALAEPMKPPSIPSHIWAQLQKKNKEPVSPSLRRSV